MNEETQKFFNLIKRTFTFNKYSLPKLKRILMGRCPICGSPARRIEYSSNVGDHLYKSLAGLFRGTLCIHCYDDNRFNDGDNDLFSSTGFALPAPPPSSWNPETQWGTTTTWTGSIGTSGTSNTVITSSNIGQMVSDAWVQTITQTPTQPTLPSLDSLFSNEYLGSFLEDTDGENPSLQNSNQAPPWIESTGTNAQPDSTTTFQYDDVTRSTEAFWRNQEEVPANPQTTLYNFGSIPVSNRSRFGVISSNVSGDSSSDDYPI